MKKVLVLALAAVMVLGVAGAAFAATQTITTAPYAGAVTVDAKVNTKVELSLSEDALNAGILDPETAPTWTDTVTVATKSNVPCALSAAVTGSVNAAGQPTFTSSLAAAPEAGLRGVTSRDDTYNMAVDWDTNPGDYQATITYTLTAP